MGPMREQQGRLVGERSNSYHSGDPYVQQQQQQVVLRAQHMRGEVKRETGHASTQESPSGRSSRFPPFTFQPSSGQASAGAAHTVTSGALPLHEDGANVGSVASNDGEHYMARMRPPPSPYAAHANMGSTAGAPLGSLPSQSGNTLSRAALFNSTAAAGHGGSPAMRNIVLQFTAPTSGQPGAGGMGPLSDIPELEEMGRRGSGVGSAESRGASYGLASQAATATAAGYGEDGGLGVTTRGREKRTRTVSRGVQGPYTNDFGVSDPDSKGKEEDEDDFSEEELSLRSRGSSLRSEDGSARPRRAKTGAAAAVSGAAGMEDDTDDEDFDEEDDEEEGRRGKRDRGGARKARARQLLCEQDPDAPGLTLEQRRKIRRRINNRASARRVRQKRDEDLHRICSTVSRLDEERQRLMQRANASQAGCAQMAAQLREVRNRWQVACLTNSGLHKELGALRSHLQALHGRPSGAQHQQHHHYHQEQQQQGMRSPSPQAHGSSMAPPPSPLPVPHALFQGNGTRHQQQGQSEGHAHQLQEQAARQQRVRANGPPASAPSFDLGSFFEG